MRLSIIIPIYNVEDTLQRCLESVLTQMDERMEVILIDDGSTDSSGKIAEEMTANKGNCRLIRPKKQGSFGSKKRRNRSGNRGLSHLCRL